MTQARNTLVIDEKHDEKKLACLIEKYITKQKEFVVLDFSQNQNIWQLINSYVRENNELITVAKYHRKYSKREISKIKKYFREANIFSHNSVASGGFGKLRTAPVNDTDLITITIHNYEYCEYLRDCFDSVFNQENVNYEVIFSDNASVDKSWSVALEYQEKYPNKITIIRNNKNYGPSRNLKNCLISMAGKVHIQLCSDDYLLPGCLKKCLKIFKDNTSIAFAIFHRKIKDVAGRIICEKPFYDKSGIIPGLEQAAVYMMAAVNPTISQVCYRNDRFPGINDENPLSRWWAPRINDFKLSMQFDVGYITEPLIVNRVHDNRDSARTESKLIEIAGTYILNYYFLDASNQNKKIKSREEMSIKKLSQLSLRYAARAVLRRDFKLAKRYLHLSHALMLDPEIENTAEYKIIKHIIKNKAVTDKDLAKINKINNFLVRERSYPLPEGSRLINI